MDMNMKEYVNWKMSHDVKFGEAEGYPLVLENCRKNKDLKNFRVYGNSVHDKGENLFNEETATAGVYIDDVGDEAEGVTEGLRLGDYIEVKSFTNYNLILTNNNANSSGVARLNLYDVDKNWVSQTKYSIATGDSLTKSVTIVENIYYVRISFAGDIEFYEDLNPENPLEIQSVGELTTKNLLKYDLMGAGHSPGTSFMKSFMISNLIKFDSGTYTLSYNISNATTYRLHWVVFSDNGETELTTKAEADTYATVTLKANRDTGYYSTNNRFFMLNGNTSVSYNDAKITVLQPCYIGFHVSGGDMSVKSVVTEQQLELGEVKTDYEPFGKYKISVTARGKNILDMNKHTVSNGYYYDVNGLPFDTNNNLLKISPIAVEPSTTYTISSNVPVYTIWLFKGGDSTSISRIDVHKKIRTFTTSQECTQIRVSLDLRKMVTDEVQAISLFQWAMLEKGTGDGIFEPYIKPQTFNIYLDEPLRKIGDYADYIDFEEHEDVRNIEKKTYRGETSEAWYREKYRLFIYNTPALKIFDSLKTGCLSNRFRGQTWQNLWYNYQRTEGDRVIGIALQDRGVINVTPYQTIPTVGDWKKQLKQWHEEGNPFTVLYVIPPKRKAIELPELPKTQAKTMIYEIDTNILPRNMSAKYVKKY